MAGRELKRMPQGGRAAQEWEKRDGQRERRNARSCSVGETQPNEAISSSAAPLSLPAAPPPLPTDQTDLQNEFVSVSV